MTIFSTFSVSTAKFSGGGILRNLTIFFLFQKPVYDVAWSPRSSTVFACVNEGAVEVWDLNVST